jgi:polyribonucleotide nucleotidyltransferase
LAISALRKETVEALEESYSSSELNSTFDILVKYSMRQLARNSGIRVDGRGLDEVRPIFIQTNVYPRLHGSAIFQRGQSQVINFVGSKVIMHF